MAHHADQLAERLGEPLGTLVLTLILVRPISGRVGEIDGLMLLTVGVAWVALPVVS